MAIRYLLELNLVTGVFGFGGSGARHCRAGFGMKRNFDEKSIYCI
jgi:hypothetical protein